MNTAALGGSLSIRRRSTASKDLTAESGLIGKTRVSLAALGKKAGLGECVGGGGRGGRGGVIAGTCHYFDPITFAL